jgi:hypothetical protein
MKLSSLLLAFTLTAKTLCAAADGVLDGEIFIVTKSAQNVRLGLVEVMMFGEKEIKEHIEKKEKRVEAEKPDFDKEIARLEGSISKFKENLQKQKDLTERERKLGADTSAGKRAAKNTEDMVTLFEDIKKAEVKRKGTWPSSRHYFKDLPQATASTRSNSDGKFSLKAPRDERIAIAARATRDLPDAKEEYYWLVWVSLDGKENKNIILGNHNVMSSGSKESVVSTKSD